MKLSKRQLRQLIKEACGDVVDVAPEPLALDFAVEPVGDISESIAPEQDLMVEMEVAQRALEQVVESVQNAAHLCHDCVPEVAAQAPLMEAMVAQAVALQETLNAQTQIVVESAGDTPVLDAIGDAAEVVADAMEEHQRRPRGVTLGFSGPGFM
jgi:hypothetical protein